MLKTVLVTGGAGFIGGNFVHYLLSKNTKIINLDSLTYAGNPDTLKKVENSLNYHFIKGNILDSDLVNSLLEQYQPEAVINFAAESHVDRSIDNPGEFVRTNVMGTFELLNSSLNYWGKLTEEKKQAFRFLHISTDEVYGTLGETGLFTEETPFAPNSPYAASKASSDHFVRAYYHTYGLPVLTTNCSNNYGPYQFPEKLIPLIIYKALAGEALPIYGDGQQVRDWLYVEDHCSAIKTVLEKGKVGETYNVGGNNEKANLEVVKTICQILDELVPAKSGKQYQEQITFVKDRPGHDRRYAIDSTKIQTELNWKPAESFETGIKKTIQWYLDNQNWVRRVMSGDYRGERLGEKS